MGTSGGGFRVGVDENGLGPRLGPLVVTAAMARLRSGAEAIVNGQAAGALGERLGDSKRLVAHGKMALGEAWTRAVVARKAGRRRRASRPDDLLRALCLDEPSWLVAPCPAELEAQCWSAEGEALSAGPRFVQLLGQVEQDLERLAEAGVELIAVRSVVTCCWRLNEAARQGHSRLVVDLHAMERLVLACRELAGEPIAAVCGKVGGYQRYGQVFGPLGGLPCAVLEQSPRRSAYRFAGLGEVAFVRNCDQSDLLVGLASLVGKYLRELLMARIVRFYQRLDGSIAAASGYGDPVTTRFIRSSEPLRKRLDVPLVCFRRG